MTELPQAFLSQMAAQLKGEMAAFLRTYDEPYQRGLRVNPWKRPTLLPDDCGERVPWEENGHYLALTSTAGADVLHEAGAWYLQEPSAMLPAAVLNAQPGEHVLDLCAAPGGKSTQSGLRMGGQGVLVCNEPVWERAKILSQNIERMGIPNALVVSAYPDQLAQRWPEAFDAIQVDAPCSGEGMFRRHPETRAEWSPESPAGCAKRQAEILDRAAEMLRPGFSIHLYISARWPGGRTGSCGSAPCLRPPHRTQDNSSRSSIYTLWPPRPDPWGGDSVPAFWKDRRSRTPADRSNESPPGVTGCSDSQWPVLSRTGRREKSEISLALLRKSEMGRIQGMSFPFSFLLRTE